MPSYKLTYFDARGRAEVTRYLLKMNDVAFEDVRVNGEKWQDLKPGNNIALALYSSYTSRDDVSLVKSTVMSANSYLHMSAHTCIWFIPSNINSGNSTAPIRAPMMVCRFNIWRSARTGG